MAERKNFSTSLVKSTLTGAALGIPAAIGTVAIITERNHRELTHQSISLHPLVQRIMDIEQRTMGMDTTIWAAVHEIHHSFEDASLYPFLKAYQAIRFLEENPSRYGRIAIPQTYPHFDPFVDAFSLEQVLEIGQMAEQHVKTKMGNEYQEPQDMSLSEIAQSIYPSKPQYYYPEFEVKKTAEEYTQDEIARIFLTDPHAPCLQQPVDGKLNGVKSEVKNNVPDFRRPGNLFRARPDLKPDYLQHKDGKALDSNASHVAAGFIIPSVATLLLRGKYKPQDFLIAAAAGSAFNGVRLRTAVKGGEEVNANGHGGKMNARDFIHANVSKEYHIKLNDDGTVSTDTVYAGALGKILGWLTLDEVGGQRTHHLYPGKIAYTERTGIKGIIDAPWGSFTEFLVKSGVPFISEGNQFRDRDLRPDVAHPMVRLIQQARVAQMEKNRV